MQSVEATRGPHINDVVSVGYAPDRKLIGVRFRTGYMLLFGMQPNGTQVIRDSQGGALIRAGGTMQSIDAAAAESTAKLASAVSDLEALLSALGQPLRWLAVGLHQHWLSRLQLDRRAVANKPVILSEMENR